jgi:hypothetical protein
MKINNRLLILTSLAFFMLAAAAYASSAGFLTQAQKYINQNCSKKKLPDQTALLCYLFEKSQEQDTDLTNAKNDIQSLKTLTTSQSATIRQLQQEISSLQNPTPTPTLTPTSTPTPTPTPDTNINTIKLTAQLTGTNEDIVHGEYSLTYNITNPSNQLATLDGLSFSGIQYDVTSALTQIQPGQSMQFVTNLSNPGTIWHTGANSQLVIQYHDPQNNHFQTVYQISLQQDAYGYYDVTGFINPVFS